MHVGVITYQTGHLKTWQVVSNLLTKSFRVSLYAFPFKHRLPKPGAELRYADRPAQLIDCDVPAFCKRYGIGYSEVAGWGDEFAPMLGMPGRPDTPDVFLHCIAKIVPASFIAGRTILNCHPGLLPQNRGVDAFKWSILNKWPLGITLHIIDEEIDRGTILCRMRIPVFDSDHLADVCRRAYDAEINLLANFDYHLPNREMRWFVGDEFACSHCTIPPETDRQIENVFQENRGMLVRSSCDLASQPHPSDSRGDGLRLPHAGWITKPE